MARELSVYARWPPGGLHIRVKGEYMVLEAANALLAFEPRLILVEARYAGYQEAADEKRRRLVIEFAEPIKPVKPPRIDFAGEKPLGLFEVRVVDLEFEKYLTAITPGSFLYDYFVVTSTRILVETSSKRRFYYEEEPYTKLIVHVT